MSGIIIETEARTIEAERNLARLNDSVKNIQGSADKTAQSMNLMAKALGALAFAGVGIAALKNISSEMTNINNKIAQATGRGQKFVQIQKQLLDISQETRSSYQATVTTFSSFNRALRTTGVSARRIADVTKTVQQTIALSGASAQTANAAIIQLGQGLSAGALRGEELNSIMENLPRLAQLFADNMGVTIGKFRLMAAEGKVSTNQMFEALVKQSKKVNEEFGKLAPTLDAVMSNLTTYVKIYIDNFAKGLGITSALAVSISKLNNYIKDASENAFDLGNRLSHIYNTIRSNIGILAIPIVGVFKALQRQLKQILPTLSLTRTFKEDFTNAVVAFDNMTGGWIQSWKRFRFATLLTWESDVEKAIRNIKRIGPQNWIGSGFNSATLKRLFSVDTIRAYAKAFRQLINAINGNLDSFGARIQKASNDADFFVRRLRQYTGLDIDTIFTFRRGVSENFLDSMSQIIRGVAGASKKIYEFGAIIRSYVYPAFDVLKESIVASFPEMLKGIIEFGKAVIKVFVSIVNIVKQVIQDILSGEDFRSVIKNLFSQSDGVFDKFLMTLSLVVISIRNFSEAVVEFAERIYNKFAHGRMYNALYDMADAYDDFFSSIFRKISIFRDRNLVKNSFTSMFEAITGAIRDGVSWAKKALVNGLIDLNRAIYKGLRNLLANSNPSGIFKAISDKLYSRYRKQTLKFTFKFDRNGFDEIIYLINLALNQLAMVFTLTLNYAYNGIKAFVKGTIELFKELFDKIIGNSYWTDTIDAITDSAQNLWDNVSGGFNKFKQNVLKVFKDIKEKAGDITIGSRKVNLGGFEFKIPEIRKRNFADAFKDIFEEMKGLYESAVAAFPQIMKFALTGLAGVVVAALFPKGKFKTYLLGAIIFSLATSGTLIADEFGKKLTDQSFISKVGFSFGAIAGEMTASFLRELPKIGRAFLAFISSFIEGFTRQLPIIGKIIRSIFNVADMTGLAGPLGLVGAVLFGKYGLNFLRILGIFEKPIRRLQTLFASMAKVISGQTTGAVTAFLFGQRGGFRTLSILGMILDYLGVFDTMFQNSPLMHMALRGGLLYLSLFGAKGFDKIYDTVDRQVLIPIANAIKNLGKTVTSGTPLYDVLFGKQGTMAERASTFAKVFIDSFNRSVVASLAPTVGKTWNFLQRLLFGENPQLTRALFVRQFLEMKDWAKGKLAGAFEGIGGLISFMAGVVQDATKKINTLLSSLNIGLPNLGRSFSNLKDPINNIAGQNGLLGRAFLGGAIKRILLMTALLTALFAFMNKATADTVIPAEKSQSIFGRMFDKFKEFQENNPIKTLILETAAALTFAVVTMYARMRWELRKFRLEAQAEMAGLAAGGVVGGAVGGGGVAGTAGRTAATGVAGAIGRNKKVIGSAIGAAIAGGIAYSATGGDLISSVVWSSLGLQIGASLAGAIAKGLTRLLAPATIALLGTAAAWAAAASAVIIAGGLLYIWLFGKKGNFKEDLRDTTDSIRKLLGLKVPERPSSKTGLNEEQQKFLDSQGINTKTIDISKINTERLSPIQKETLQKRLEEVVTQVNDSISKNDSKDFNASGKAALEDLVVGFGALVEKYTAKSAYDLDKFNETVEQFSKKQEYSWASQFATWLKQKGLDVTYEDQKLEIESTIKWSDRWARLAQLLKGAGGSETVQRQLTIKENAQKALSELEASKDTKFNARYQPLSERDARIKVLINQTKEIENINSELAEKLATQQEIYLNLFRDSNEKTAKAAFMFWSFEAQANAAEAKIAFEKAGEDIEKTLRESLRFDAETKRILVFRKSLDTLQAEFKAADISIDTDKIFVADDKQLERLKEWSVEAKFLGEQLKQVKNIAERNAIVVRLNYIQKEIDIAQLRANLEDGVRSQFKAKDLASEFGLDFSEELYKTLSDEAADSINRALTEAAIARKNQSLKPLDLEQQPFGPTYKKRTRPLLTLLSQPEYDVFGAPVADTFEPIKTGLEEGLNTAITQGLISLTERKRYDPFGFWSGIVETLKPDQKSFAALKRLERDNIEFAQDLALFSAPRFLGDREAANYTGIDYSAAVKAVGADKAGPAIRSLLKDQRDLRALIEDPTASGDAVDSLTRSIERQKEALQQLPSDISEVVSSINSLGYSINLKDLSIFDDNEILQIKLAGNQIKAAEKFLKDTSGSFDGATVRQYNEIIRTADESLEKLIRKTYLLKRIDTLKAAGLGDYGTIARLSDTEQARLIELQTNFAILEKRLSDTARASELESNLRKLKEIKDEMDAIIARNEGKTFKAQLGNINEVFKTDFNELDYASMSKSFRRELSNSALALKEEQRRVEESGGDGALAFYTKMKELVNKFGILSLFRNVSNGISDSLVGGAEEGLSRIKSIFEDFSLSIEAYSLLPTNIQQETEQNALMLDALTKLNKQRNIVGDPGNLIKSEISRLQNPDVSIKEVYDNIERISSGIFDKTKPPVEQMNIALLENTSSTITLTNTIDRLISTLEAPKLMAASGGKVSGPGSGKSDSIPAMLSNGEFVVNANSTRKNLALLKRINDGKIAKFANGGLLEDFEEFSIRAGYSVSKQLDDLAYMVEHPIDTAKTFASLFKTVAKDPKAALSAGIESIQDMYSMAMSGPGGFGEVFGTVINPRSILNPSSLLKNPLKITAEDAKKKADSVLQSESFNRALEVKKKFERKIGSTTDISPRIYKAYEKELAETLDFSIAKDPIMKTPLGNFTPLDRNIFLEKGLMPESRASVLAHEVGHLISYDDYLDGNVLKRSSMDRMVLRSIAKNTDVADALMAGSPLQIDVLGLRAPVDLSQYKKFIEEGLPFGERYSKDFVPEEYLASALGSKLSLGNPEDYWIRPIRHSDNSLYNIFDESDMNMKKAFGEYLKQEKMSKILNSGMPANEMMEALEQLDSIRLDAELLKYKELFGFATGGFVKGPGSSKSDSIPAMLSNGEFVINADSAKKNRDLLHAINEGKVGRFAEGRTEGDLSEIKITTARLGSVDDLLTKFNGTLLLLRKNVITLLNLQDAISQVKDIRFQNIAFSQQGGYSPDVSALNRASSQQALDYNLLAKSLSEKNIKLKDAEIKGNQIDIQKAQKAYDQALVEIENFMEEGLENMAKKIDEVGKGFTEAVGGSLKTSITDILKGNEDFKSATDAILGGLASEVIDTFVAGLTDRITGKGGMIQRFSDALGKAIFGLGSNDETKAAIDASLPQKTGNKLTDLKNVFFPPKPEIPPMGADVVKQAGAYPVTGGLFPQSGGLPPGMTPPIPGVPAESGVGSLATAITGPIVGQLSSGDAKQSGFFGQILGFFPMVFGLLGNLITTTAVSGIGFASGGKVIGGGTGTSDSIPAMLSNGEFVINAKAATKHLGLLNAINSGNIKRYADGGLVGASIMTTPSMSDLPTKSISNKSSTMVNLNITGDISRQTKAEIYKMLPTIAEGVNGHNKERGYRNQSL